MRLSNNTKLYVGIVIALIIGVAVGYFARARMTKRVDVDIYQMIMSALTGTFEGGNYAGGLMEQWIGLCNLPSFGNRAQRLREGASILCGYDAGLNMTRALAPPQYPFPHAQLEKRIVV